jgi:hypothetical protein
MKYALLAVISLLVMSSSSTALGQAFSFSEKDRNGKELDVQTAWELTLTSAREPKPALQYSLWPRYWERKYGDATPHYYRALVIDGDLSPDLEKQYIEKSEAWLANEVTDATKLEMRNWLVAHRDVIKELGVAAHRERLELDVRLRDLSGMEAISFLLPDAQNMRKLARMLAIKARLEIADGQVDEAIRTLRVGYRLAEAAAKTPTLINDLVGVAIASIMTHELTRVVASSDSPNLYWAISQLPRPFIDLRESLEHESELPLQIFPFLRDAETVFRSPDEWRRLMLDTYLKFHELSGDYRGKPGPLTDIAATVLMMKSYPVAKRYLIDNGIPLEKVEAMPVGQVLAICTARIHREVYDEMFKWTFLPPAQVHGKWEAAYRRLQDEGHLGPGNVDTGAFPIVDLLLPALQPAWYAPLRLERQLAALRVIEAIRMHAAENGGKLPASLDEISAAVVPLDPLYEKPFAYRVDGKTAILEIPPRSRSQPQHDAVRYTIKIKE